MRFILVAMLISSISGWDRVAQGSGAEMPGLLVYNDVDQAAAALVAEMRSTSIGAEDPASSSLMVYGFEAHSDQRLELFSLDQTLAGKALESGFELFEDPYMRTMRREMGIRPADKLTSETMLIVADDMDVKYMLSGVITTNSNGLKNNEQNARMTLSLTEVSSGKVAWTGQAALNLEHDSPLVSW